MKIDPGTYKAKIKDYGVTEGKGGNLQVMIRFGIFNGGDISYFGNLGNAEQQEYTTKNLLTLGATPSNIDKVEAGPTGGVLDMNKEFEIVVEDNEWPKNSGKVNSRIKFINDPSIPRSTLKKVQGTGALSALKGQAAALIAADPSLKQEAKKPVDNVGF